MSDAIRRVALALFERDRDRTHAFSRLMFGSGDVEWKDLAARTQGGYLDEAETAIAALRDPTPEMLAAGADCAGETIDPGVATDVRLGWQAMIDEALK